MDFSAMALPAHRNNVFSPTRMDKGDIGDLKSPPMSPREPPACVQNAMMNKEKKPFTYTPGGLDLSQIRSEKMARRLMINAMSPGVQERPAPPTFTPPCESPSVKPPVNYYNMPVPVFPMIQIPTNPKELLRRTSGPYSRTDSVDKELEVSPPKEPVIKNICKPKEKESIVKQNKEITQQDVKENPIDPIPEVKQVEEPQCPEPIPEEIIEPRVPEIEQSAKNIVNGDIELTVEHKIERSPTPVRLASPVLNGKCDEEEKNEDTSVLVSNEIEINKNEELNSIPAPEQEVTTDDAQDEDGDITPKIDVDTKLFESVLLEMKKKENASNVIKEESLGGPRETDRTPVSKSVSPLPMTEKVESQPSFMRENRDSIVSRRNNENIKSLNNDLDNLPSLNLCSKRFSFLSESSAVSDDDPYSIVTGIPPKISLIDRKVSKDIKIDPPKIEILPPWKQDVDNNIPDISMDYMKAYDSKFSIEPPWDPNSKISLEKSTDSYQQQTPQFNEYSKDWKSNSWTKTKPTENLQPVNSQNNNENDNEPAWKRELREIANQKREAQQESEFYKEEIEPPWRRELRELSESRSSRGSSTTKEVKYNVEPTWKPTCKLNYSKSNVEDKSSITNPLWSQTVRPKTWRERKADLARDKEVEIPEWKKVGELRRNIVNSFINKSTPSSSSCSSPARDIRKTPEITVEIAGHPTSTPANTGNSNGYTYPWESSSESSTAFSPEPYMFDRTPTPQSRNSPFRQTQQYVYADLHSPSVPREYGTLSYQPNRRQQIRSCPIQSRSFKYLQLLTGTTDTYEDDEPFIPQSPLHAHLRPENL